MTSCWAESLGECSEKISREHIVSKAIFLDKDVSVSGLPWCIEPKAVGLQSLAARILCAKHNSALSVLDQIAVDFTAALRESLRLLDVRMNLKRKRWRMATFPINGYLLERWCLKTVINAAVAYGGPDSSEADFPSPTLVEIAFGKRAFEAAAGLYGIHDDLEARPREDGLALQFFKTQRNRVQGAIFSFLGFRLLLYLDAKEPPLPMVIATERGVAAETFTHSHHPFDIAYHAGVGISHKVKFEWR